MRCLFCNLHNYPEKKPDHPGFTDGQIQTRIIPPVLTLQFSCMSWSFLLLNFRVWHTFFFLACFFYPTSTAAAADKVHRPKSTFLMKHLWPFPLQKRLHIFCAGLEKSVRQLSFSVMKILQHFIKRVKTRLQS